MRTLGSLGEGLRRCVFVIVAQAALLFAASCWSVVAAMPLLPAAPTRAEDVALGALMLVFDVLAALWLFRKIQSIGFSKVGLRIALAFVMLAPLVFGFSNLLGEFVGGYTEILLGNRFILPAVIVGSLAMMALVVPGAIVVCISPHLPFKAVLGKSNQT